MIPKTPSKPLGQNASLAVRSYTSVVQNTSLTHAQNRSRKAEMLGRSTEFNLLERAPDGMRAVTQNLLQRSCLEELLKLWALLQKHST